MAATKSSRQNRARIVAGSVLVLLIVLLFGLGAVLLRVLQPAGAPKPGSLASGMTWVRSIYGFGPRPDQQLFEPIGVAVDTQGRIYVSEPQRSRITVYRRDGSFDGLITLMKNHDVSLARPSGMDLDADGNLYVADEALQRIVVFDSQRRFVRNIEDGVTGVRVVGDRLYGIGRDHVSIFSLKGELISRFGKMGRTPGQLDGAYAVAVDDDGLIYVIESFNKRVSVFKPNGDFVRAFGRQARARSSASASGAPKPSAEDTSEVLFDLPTGLVFDGSGRLVSLDAFQFQLAAFDTKGKLAGMYGGQGTEDGSFIYPSGLAYDRAGDVFVIADTRNNRVQVVRIAGSGRARLDRLVPASFLQPICYGPLALLLLAVIATVVVSRRRNADVSTVTKDAPAEQFGE